MLQSELSAGRSTNRYDTAPAVGLSFKPFQVFKRQPIAWAGIGAEIVRFSGESYEFSFSGPIHTLIATERGTREEGESRVEGAEPSRLRDIGEKLLVIPAGRKYGGWSRHPQPFEITAVFLDPKAAFLDPEIGFHEIELPPKLHFEDDVLRATIKKLKDLVEDPGAHNRLYAESLGSVLALELMRWRRTALPRQTQLRGGLSAWQKRIVCEYIEDHLGEDVSLAKLAALANISPYHLCRAFKQSVGAPPHRYLSHRRIERAKELLADRTRPITDIALTIGFAGSSHLTNAFRKATGHTPSEFRRGLD